MAKIKTNDLIGRALDWAVACIEHAKGHDRNIAFARDFQPYTWPNGFGNFPSIMFKPSSDWRQGGTIIERESINLIKVSDGPGRAKWSAVIDRGQQDWVDAEFLGSTPFYYFQKNELTSGPTPLIAAMRCFVASKLGDEVDVPDELGGA